MAANAFSPVGEGVYRADVTADVVLSLKDASGRRVGRWVIQVDGGASKSIVPKGVLHGSGVAAAGAEPLHYLNRKDGTLVDPGTTPITLDGLYDVFSDGCDVYLDVDWTSGTATIYARAVEG